MSIAGQKQQYLMYINGTWVRSESEEWINVINPATNEVVGVVPKGGKMSLANYRLEMDLRKE